MTRPAAVPHHGSTMSDVQTYTTPEAEHLADQERLLAELTEQLATKETEFATIGAELARFRVHYLRRFAPLYAEIDRLDAEIARHIAAKDDSRAAHARAAEAAARADESREAEAGAGEAGVASDEVAERTQPPPELRDLYRQAAKKLVAGALTATRGRPEARRGTRRSLGAVASQGSVRRARPRRSR